MKRGFTFGQDYLNKCHVGVAVVKGQNYYWLTDRYTAWLITDMDPATRSVQVKVWTDKPAETRKAKRRA